MKEPYLSSETLAKLTSVFVDWPELVEVVLYGSRAIGTATPRSDIDLATRGIKDELRLGRLALDLDDLNIPQRIEVQEYDRIGYLPLRRHIDTFGISLYQREPRSG
jgi:predicted nucleotidyltransferase